MDKNQSKPIKVLISEQEALTVMFYFGQVFSFWSLINKNVSECFLLTICKEHTLTRFTKFFSRNHPKLYIWLRREGWQMLSSEPLLHQIDTNSHRRCSIKNFVLKNFTMFTGKHWRWSLLLVKLSAFRTANLWERDSNTNVFLLQNF